MPPKRIFNKIIAPKKTEKKGDPKKDWPVILPPTKETKIVTSKETTPISPPRKKTGKEIMTDVQAAMARPPPTKTTPTARRSLFPWLALGFGPAKTSGDGLKCGINALHRSYRDARDALTAPGDARIKRHVTQQDFRDLLGSDIHKALIEEFLEQFSRGGADGGMAEEQIEEERQEALAMRNVNMSSLGLLLETANRTWETDFELGSSPKAITWDSEFTFATETNATQENNGRPIIWVWNNNAETIERAHGCEGGINHWEAFGSPATMNTPARRNFVRDWNLGEQMRQHIAAGVWRVTRDQLGDAGEVRVAVGAFVHALPIPDKMDVPVGSRFVATASERTFLTISEDDLIQIELHRNAPNSVDGGAGFIDDPDPETEEERKSDSNVHDDAQNGIDAALKAVLDKVNVLTFFRGITPTNRVGGVLTAEELPSLTRGKFQVTNGDFFLDLGERRGPWVRVRAIEGREGWAHIRRLQALELPWNIPRTVPFKVKWTVVDNQWDPKRMIDEQRKRGLALTGNRQDALDNMTAWDAQRMSVLPMRQMNYTSDDHKHGTWSDGTDILDRELVLEAGVIEENVSTMIVSFDRETSIIGPNKLHVILGATWGIRMTPEELADLLIIIGKTSYPTVPAPAAAEVDKEEASPGKGGKKRKCDEDNKESEVQESPKSPKKLKGREKPKKNAKKVTFADEDLDELSK